MNGETNKKSASALRKEVYDYLDSCCVDLNQQQQGKLSSILKSVYEHRIIESRKENDAPIRHEIVCPKCQGIKIKHKGGFKAYRKSIKLAGGVVTPPNPS